MTFRGDGLNVKRDVQVGLGAAPWGRDGELANALQRDVCSAILDALPLGVFVLRAHDSRSFCNRAGVDILGRGVPEGIRPEGMALAFAAYRAHTDQLYPTEALPIIRALRGEVCTANDIELRHRTPSVLLQVWAAPLLDANGEVQFALATFARAESRPHRGSAEPLGKRDHGRELRQSHRLEAVGQLAAGVAHEINTPMQYIGDNTAFLGITLKRLLDLTSSFERLVAHCQAGSPPRDAVDSCARELKKARMEFLREQAPSAIAQSLAGIEHVRSIVQALKEFSHPGEDQPVLVDINHLVKMAMTVTRNAWRYHAEVVLELEENLHLVLGYPQELGQVLINLIVNSAHAIEERAVIAADGPAGKIVIRSVARDAAVEIQVNDNGAGIPAGIADRVMDPFFTTKPAGKGTGQGLALARGVVVDRHGGKLSFSSTVGSGTTFSIHLPATSDA